MIAYLVWSNEHRMWWRANHCGYTGSIEEAGRYPHPAAERIAAEASCDGALLHGRTDPMTGRQYRQAPEVLVPAPENTDPGWVVARDTGAECRRCDRPVRRGEAYTPPGLPGGRPEHVHCPDADTSGAT